jgi:hypothetical protein
MQMARQVEMGLSHSWPILQNGLPSRTLSPEKPKSHRIGGRAQYAHIEESKTAQTILSNPKSHMA